MQLTHKLTCGLTSPTSRRPSARFDLNIAFSRWHCAAYNVSLAGSRRTPPVQRRWDYLLVHVDVSITRVLRHVKDMRVALHAAQAH
jgi:hypothetical protein